jgi:hypothetical protein
MSSSGSHRIPALLVMRDFRQLSENEIIIIDFEQKRLHFASYGGKRENSSGAAGGGMIPPDLVRITA